MIKEILQGMVIGIANIIPGVSGGTMMVAMGIYDRLIHSITHLKSELKKSLRFLLPVFAGCGIAIVLLSRIFEFLLNTYPVPTNFAFCGLIAGSLPFITKKVKNKKTGLDTWVPFLLLFVLVVGLSFLSGAKGTDKVLTFSFFQLIVLFFVGVIAAATMVIPGVSGSMMLMLMGYYEPILNLVNQTVDALIHFQLGTLFSCIGLCIPFGLGVIFGIFAIAKLIEWIFSKWEVQAYWAIIGLILASPIAILINMSWTGFSILQLIIGIITFGLGWFVASKLGGE